MKIAVVIALFIAVAAANGCKDNPVADDVPAGAFRYVGYDTLGHAVVRGYLRITLTDSARIIGEWALVRVNDGSQIGPQTGTGVLDGYINGTTIGLNLNPNMIDNNVLLSGVLQGNTYTGTWMYVGFPGILNRGAFAARR